MALLGVDIGGTKLALAVFTRKGEIRFRKTIALEKRKSTDTGRLIKDEIVKILDQKEYSGDDIISAGISVPGIYFSEKGTVWAPNIPEWDDYPLLKEIESISGAIPVAIDSDRACYILGEVWKGNAAGCRNAIFLAVGTGIGAGILVNGEILRGTSDIAGAIGWMALDRPFNDRYRDCGCFEYHASGEGIARIAREYLNDDREYSGELKRRNPVDITSHDIFDAYENGDTIAVKVIGSCIGYWGMAVANLVSLFNPEKVILGGGVFGPAGSLITAIRSEAARWAQPVGIKQVRIELSGLSGDAGVYGAGFLALRNIAD